MELEDELFSLREMAYLCRLTIKEAEEEVCNCNSNGYVCDYHRNMDSKRTLKGWQDMSIGQDYSAFRPVNDMKYYPKTKRLEK